MQKPILTLICLIACLLFSCKAPNETNSVNDSHQNTANTALTDSEYLADAEEPNRLQPNDSLTSETINSLGQLYKRLNRKASYFVINTNRDTLIRCKNGTLLTIPANAFLNAATQSAVNGEVKIVVKEFYKLSEMMMAGLSTTSNNQLLETGGMINIKVTQKETRDSCILKAGKNINIAMPSTNPELASGMQLFNGVHDSADINWIPRAGSGGLAQLWRGGQSNLNSDPYPLRPAFIFPDGLFKIKPSVINSSPENLQAEIMVSIRDLMRQVGVVTKKANGYIDTSGNLHCYNIIRTPQQTTFPEIYSVTVYKEVKVNLGVDVNVSYQSNLNHDYYLKLFKMGKGNPDSLVAITATLNPTVKLTGFDKIKSIYSKAVTLQEYLVTKKRMASLREDYLSRIKQLKLENEAKLIKFEKEGASDIQSAQDYLILNTNKLGWINCDRFYKAPETIEYFVNLESKASLLIVFNNIKSIMASDEKGRFTGVPINEPITLVGIKTQDGKLMMALHETTVTKQGFDRLNFKPVTVKEYKTRLERLNRL